MDVHIGALHLNDRRSVDMWLAGSVCCLPCTNDVKNAANTDTNVQYKQMLCIH